MKNDLLVGQRPSLPQKRKRRKMALPNLLAAILTITLVFGSVLCVYAEEEPDALPRLEVSNDAGKAEGELTQSDLLTYTVHYTNSTTTPNAVTIIDVLPVGVDFISATDEGAYDVESHTVTWLLPAVAETTSGFVSVIVQVNDMAVEIIENEATVQVGEEASVATNKTATAIKLPTISPFGIAAINSFDNIKYAATPPASAAVNIGNTFSFVGETGYDFDHPNVAVIANDEQYKYGAMWANEKLDLSSPFRTEMYLYMGHGSNFSNPANGAGDGMTFTLHNDPRGAAALGSDGEGLGAYGSTYYLNYAASTNPVLVIQRALCVEFDLVSNDYTKAGTLDHYMQDPVTSNDNTMGHCSIIYPPVDLTGPKAPLSETRILASHHLNTFTFSTQADWVLFTATWTPEITGGVLGGTLKYSFGGESKSLKIGDVTSRFGATDVFWGFTGSTGLRYGILAAAVTEWPDPTPKKEVTSATGKDGAEVAVGDVLTYGIKYKNYDSDEAKVVITDVLPSGVDYVSSDNNGQYDSASHTVTWTLNDVPGKTRGMVKVDVKVNASAVVKIENEATVKVGARDPQTSNKVENPIAPPKPEKKVTSETGKNGAKVKVGDVLTYSISYENYVATDATISIKDDLPTGVDFVSATDEGQYDTDSHSVEWKLSDIASGTRGTVSVTVKVNSKAIVMIGNDAIVKVNCNDPQTSNKVENPIEPPKPEKKVTSETGKNGADVSVGDVLTYGISYENFDVFALNITITDVLPFGVDYVSSGSNGQYDPATHTVTWTLDNVKSGTRGTVSVTVKVNKDAVVKIENEATVKLEDHDPQTSNKVENPIPPSEPEKTVTSAVGANGAAVAVGDVLTYSISYENYDENPATITITDVLPQGVDYVSSTAGGKYDKNTHTVTWVIGTVASGTRSAVSVNVVVNALAIVKIENDATVQVGNHTPKTSNKVENPVTPADPQKRVSSVTGANGSAVKVGDVLTYSIVYENYDTAAADIVITDALPDGVDFVDASDNGQYDTASHTVTWTLNNVSSGIRSSVTVTVEVNPTAVVKIENEAIVKVGAHAPKTSNKVVNPITPTVPVKKVTSTTGANGSAVNVGDVLTYSISYENYADPVATITIIDKLPLGVDFVSASNNGRYDAASHTVTWTLSNIASGIRGTVNVNVRVNASAVVKIENDATVKVGNHSPQTSNKVENPIPPTDPVKTVTSAAGANGAAVNVGDVLTYSISYENYADAVATITIIDKLPLGVDYASSSNNGRYDPASHTVIWTIANVPSGMRSAVTVTVQVSSSAVEKIENDATVKVGNHSPQTSNKVENPVIQPPQPPAPPEPPAPQPPAPQTPKTGDSSMNMGVLLLMIIASGGLLTGLIVSRKKGFSVK